ncbi:MAG: Ubiquinone biosynthesis O-methyltransferase [candidate division WS2 bacterium]|nr:Ubiquinone biosynthesis O-methyltransferase [Candidatus Psychracetigena formicireducens]
MKEKTSREYWDKIWGSNELLIDKVKETILNVLFKAHPSNRIIFGLFNNILQLGDRRCLEIGCATARYLEYFFHRFGLEIYGVDYSEAGCKLAEELLRRTGAKGEIMCLDIFDPSFQEQFDQYFDIVCSFGFIEHFTDPLPIIDVHRKLLRRGGRMFITIPNFCSTSYYRKARRLSGREKELLATHNVEIMEISKLKNLVREFEDLEILKLDYVGPIYIADGLIGNLLSNLRIKLFRYPLLLLLHILSIIIGYLTFVYSSPWSSPTIVLIVRKC